MSFTEVDYKTTGHVAIVTLNRPESLNALNPDMIDALNTYFEGLQRNRSTRVVVLTGAGASRHLLPQGEKGRSAVPTSAPCGWRRRGGWSRR